MQLGSLCWEDSLEEVMAAHSSILAWTISWTEESGRLLSIGFQRVGHNWSDFACTHARNLDLIGYKRLPWWLRWLKKKNTPAMWETWIHSLHQENPLEDGMATHSSILASRISMDRGAWWATGSQRVGHDWAPKQKMRNNNSWQYTTH